MKKIQKMHVFAAIPVLGALAARPKTETQYRDILSKKYIAHRGIFRNPKTPENSHKAFANAVKAGFAIELDVQLTKDNQCVVFHDWNLKRMCGVDKEVCELTLKEIKKFHLGSSKETVPELRDVLQQINGRVPLLVEIKAKPGMAYQTCTYAQQILDEYHGEYIIESFNPCVLFWYRRNAKDIIRGQLADNFMREDSCGNIILDFLLSNMIFNFLTKPDFISYNWKHMKIPAAWLCRKLYHCSCFAWTIKSKRDLNKCKDKYDHLIFDSFIPDEVR